MTIPPNPHPVLLVNLVLPTGLLARTGQYDGVLQAVVRNDWCQVLVLLSRSHSVASLPARLLLLLCPFGRAASTLIAAAVLAPRACVARAKGCLALVAGPVNPNSYWLLYPKDIAPSRIPFSGLYLQAKPVTQPPRTLIVYLRARYPGGILRLSRLGGYSGANMTC